MQAASEAATSGMVSVIGLDSEKVGVWEAKMAKPGVATADDFSRDTFDLVMKTLGNGFLADT